MKRFCAALISILLILLCGCKSTGDLLSDFGEKFGNTLSKAYDNINRMISGAVSGVVEESEIDKSETVIILPGKISSKAAGLKAYNKLNAKQRKLYSIMLTAIRNMELKDVDITSYVSKNAFSGWKTHVHRLKSGE